MIETTLAVREDQPIGRISPRLYGHFAEHLGRCCYDGLWIGTNNTQIPHYKGFRADVVDALRAMPVPMLRWPGGCYADHYHWRDGIGPSNQRPTRLGLSCGLQVEDDNSLGTHEFMYLCQLLGAEPYLAGNMGSGSAQELCDWVEYCNTTVNTTLARERTSNGSASPFGVKLWGVGNENWGCGGNYDVEFYAREYRRYATMLRHVDPAAELVACGQEDEWNTKFMETNRRHLELMDHLSIHRYWIHGGAEIDFTEEQYYALLNEAHETEDFVLRTSAIIQEYAGSNSRPIGIALDEWGVWHPEARSWGPDSQNHRTPITYEQANTMRDAVATAIALEGFHRQCNILTLANLAQIVNVLHAPVMTDGASIWLTPTYYVLQLHKPHIGATALPVEITHGYTQPAANTDINVVSATASVRDGQTAVTLINRHHDQPASVTLIASQSQIESAYIISGDRPNSTNDLNNPIRIQSANLQVNPDGVNQWRIELSPHSIATLQFRS
ncbi:MAG: alpha-N-arabinofuranosidase [Anaerolineae bacterium]|nr:alpha-N-arabinofuranosidase [Anaerolineae bacterium]